MNCDEANKLPIIGFLNSLGIEPKRISGNAYWYISPTRNEKTASMKVDVKLNRWYDYGTAEGGKLVDLGTRLFNTDVSGVLLKLSNQNLSSFSFEKPEILEESKFEIRKIKSLENKALVDYLTERGIPIRIAKDYCNELYYKIGEKNYFAIGFKNDSGGFEIRNRYFKACLGKKDITTIQNSEANKVVLFEGYIDFLSYLKKSGPKMGPASFLILNSVNQIERAKRKLEEILPLEIEAFFDNDEAGKRCFESLQKDFANANDQSIQYRASKDLNESITSKKERTNEISM